MRDGKGKDTSSSEDEWENVESEEAAGSASGTEEDGVLVSGVEYIENIDFVEVSGPRSSDSHMPPAAQSRVRFGEELFAFTEEMRWMVQRRLIERQNRLSRLTTEYATSSAGPSAPRCTRGSHGTIADQSQKAEPLTQHATPTAAAAPDNRADIFQSLKNDPPADTNTVKPSTSDAGPSTSSRSATSASQNSNPFPSASYISQCEHMANRLVLSPWFPWPPASIGRCCKSFSFSTWYHTNISCLFQSSLGPQAPPEGSSTDPTERVAQFEQIEGMVREADLFLLRRADGAAGKGTIKRGKSGISITTMPFKCEEYVAACLWEGMKTEGFRDMKVDLERMENQAPQLRRWYMG
ncbi:MAG: hypothetical protein M1820_003090 [Bogoriella megaspora]|nr:MAG: hypothetical protein M1820_003090 [Bogoriella megaspora]